MTFTTLYPNSAQPFHAVFVERRLQRLVASGEAAARVVAPVPWFPFRSRAFGRYATFASVPASERRNGLPVTHPRYPVFPRVGMSAAAWSMARFTRSHVRDICRDFEPDLIDAHYFYPDGVAAVLLARESGLPVVITARGSDVNLLAEFPGPRRQILRAAAECAAIITVSESLKLRLLAMGVDAAKVTVLRNGVDLAAFTVRDDDSPSGTGPPAFLSVGNLVPNKGHDVVIRAVAGIPGAVLTIAGDGPLRAELQRLARGIGVGDRVAFVGQVGQEALVQLYNRATATVLASAREGMPNVVLESLACGTPVIASRVGGVPEIVGGEDVGVLVDEISPEAIRLAAQRLMAAPIAKAVVRRHAEAFGWGPTIERQIELYRRVVARRHAGPGPTT